MLFYICYSLFVLFAFVFVLDYLLDLFVLKRTYWLSSFITSCIVTSCVVVVFVVLIPMLFGASVLPLDILTFVKEGGV